MAGVEDDESPDIEALTRKFADDMTSVCASLRKTRLDKAKKDPKKDAEPPV